MHIKLPSYDTPPAGAIRFNTDSNKLEVYRGGVGIGTTNQTGGWWQIDNFSADNATGGTRGVNFIGANNTTYVNNIQYITISTTGNAIDFGDVAGTTRGYGCAFSSSTRGIFAAGQSGGGNQNAIDYVTISSTGSSTTFGGLLELVRYPTGLSNSTRGLISGGLNPASTNTIQYVTIASTGNTIDFGDTSGGTSHGGASCASSTRGLIQRGSTTNIEFITISTLGNTASFGNETVSRGAAAGVSNAIRGIFAGGYVTPTTTNVVDFVTIASTGGAIDFGDLTTARGYGSGMSSSTRGVFAGGGAFPAGLNVIDYVTIMSTGNAIDFGDLIDTMNGLGSAGCSNGHGGL